MEPNEQQILRKAYDQCVELTRLLLALTSYHGATLVLKAEQLADAIHHYIVAVEKQCPYCRGTEIYCGKVTSDGNVYCYQCKNKGCLRHFNDLYATHLVFIGQELDDGTNIEAEK